MNRESNYEPRVGVKDRSHKSWRPSEELYNLIRDQFPEGYSDNKVLNIIASEWLSNKEVSVTLRIPASTLFNVNKLFPSEDSSKSIREALDHACRIKKEWQSTFGDLKL